MNNLFTNITTIAFIALVIGMYKPELIVRWGTDDLKTRKTVLKYFGAPFLIFAVLSGITLPNEEIEVEAEENIEVVEEEKELDTEIKGNDLFNKVYYEIANRNIKHDKNSIITYLDNSDFIYEEDIEINSLKVSDENTANKDYVYMTFNEMEDDPNIEYMYNISYYLDKEELEVGLSNSSTDGDKEYDSYKIHKIGSPDEKVESIKEQIVFLKEAKNEHKIEKEKLKEQALANKKEEPLELVLDVVDVNTDGIISFFIDTNLPEGTTGSIGIHNDDVDYNGQSKFIVNNKITTAGPFSLNEEAVPSGTYRVHVSTPISQLQPDDVFIEIGENYINYVGDKFEESDLGRTISFSFEIEIP